MQRRRTRVAVYQFFEFRVAVPHRVAHAANVVDGAKFGRDQLIEQLVVHIADVLQEGRNTGPVSPPSASIFASVSALTSTAEIQAPAFGSNSADGMVRMMTDDRCPLRANGWQRIILRP
jgi:hypothetical protein